MASCQKYISFFLIAVNNSVHTLTVFWLAVLSKQDNVNKTRCSCGDHLVTRFSVLQTGLSDPLGP